MSYLSNSTVLFPLKNVSRDGKQSDATDEIKSVFLDCKVYGALPSKYYRISWVGKNFSDYKYSILITEHDKATYNTDSNSSKRELNPLGYWKNNNFLPNKDGVDTVTVVSQDGSIVIEITLDYSKIKNTLLDMNDSSFIIDENCYVLGVDTNILDLDYSLGSSPDAKIFSNRFRFDFKKVHSNQLFGFWNAYSINEYINIPVEYLPTTKGVRQITHETDLVGPYIVEAVKNGDGGNRIFTGGQHSSTNGVTGNPTCITDSIQFFVDGTKRTQTGKYYGKQIDIYVQNRIMSYNTVSLGRYTHIEYVHYTIRNGKINVEVNIKPLELLNLYTYYGLQMHNNNFSHIEFLGDKKGRCKILEAQFTESSPKSECIVDTIILNDNTHQDVLEMHMDTIGLGDKRFVKDDQSQVFSVSNNAKTYFRIIGFYENTISALLFPNQVYKWSGYYHFKTRY